MTEGGGPECVMGGAETSMNGVWQETPALSVLEPLRIAKLQNVLQNYNLTGI